MNERIAAGLSSVARLLGGRVEWLDDLSFSNRASVGRVRLASGETAIVKCHVDGEARRREVAALQGLPPECRPRLLAYDDQVMVLEDLGDGPSLADVLLGTDETAARTALMRWSAALGRVAAATRGRSEASTGMMRPTLDRDGVALLADVARDWDLPEPAAAMRELTEVWDEMDATPREERSLLVCDACPDNNRILGERVVFFDFEFAGWGPPAMDAAYTLAPFCTCWCVARLPPDALDGMFDTYVHASGLADVPGLRREGIRLAALLGVWPLRHASGRAGDDGLFSGVANAPTRARQYLLLRAEWLAGQEEFVPATADFARELRDRVIERCPGLEVPLYPAFTAS